jgi:hypothetical protein
MVNTKLDHLIVFFLVHIKWFSIVGGPFEKQTGATKEVLH